MGHAMGLRHAPCGGAAGPDPAYPFANGATGAFGMDLSNANTIKGPTGTDIMGYCPNQWVSVYNYRNVMELRARNPNGVPAGVIASTPSSVLMVSGGVRQEGATIEGAFALTARASNDDPNGRLVLEGYDAAGTRLFAHRFSPFTISDGRPGDEAFVVGVPASAATLERLARLEVRDAKSGARRAARTKDATAALRVDLGAALVTTGATGAKRLQWSTATSPMVLLRDPRTGEVLAVGRTGTLDLSSVGGVNDVELLVTDGVTSIRQTVNPVSGAIRR
jgi:hypothetical protein